jgi:hypothetical protein
MTLLFGWVHIAWYANVPFFVVLALNLQTIDKATTLGVTLSLVAVALSLSAYTLKEGPDMVVFGFGWGAAMWLLALQLAFLGAVAKARLAAACPPWFSIGAIGLVIVLSGGTAVLAAHQRVVATGDEQKKLQTTTFLKLGPICIDQAAAERLERGEGAVEIIESAASPSLHEYILNLKHLHERGIAVIRYSGRDVRATDRSYLVFQSQSGSDAPGAEVTVNFIGGLQPSTPNPFSLTGHSHLDVTIHSGSRGTRSFSSYEEHHGIFCPRLHNTSEGTSVDRFVRGALERTQAISAMTPEPIAAQRVRIDRGVATAPSRKGRVQILASCDGILTEMKPTAFEAESRIARRYRTWGPIKLGSAWNAYYYLNLERIPVDEVHIVCHKDRIALVGIGSVARELHIVELSTDPFHVSRWMNMRQPEIAPTFRAFWSLADLALDRNGLSVELVEQARGYKASLEIPL